jgi:putative sterol carrier protein
MVENTSERVVRAHARAYFDDYLPTLRHQLLIEDLETLDASCRINVTDAPDGAWTLVIERGRLTRVEREGPVPEAIFNLSAETLLEVVTGELSPQQAFFSQRIDLEGDLETGMKLSIVLAPFFKRFPFHPAADKQS